MTYTTNIPAPGQSLGNSRPQIQGNFDYINTTLKINHYFNEANAGKHKFLQMPRQSPNGPATAAQEGAIYTKNVSGVPQLFWRPQSTAANGTEMQMTISTAPVLGNTGSSFLPGGLLLQWGFLNVSTTIDRTVNFVPAFSAHPYSIQFSPFHNGSVGDPVYVFFIDNTNSSNALFHMINQSGNAYGFYWMAIGPA